MDILDSRIHDPKKRGIVQTRIGPCTYEYCVNCGRRGGVVTEATDLIIWLCDDCYFTSGGIPGLVEIWDRSVAEFIFKSTKPEEKE